MANASCAKRPRGSLNLSGVNIHEAKKEKEKESTMLRVFPRLSTTQS